MEDEERAIDDLDYSDQQYYTKKENEEENELERQSSSSESEGEEGDAAKGRCDENPEEIMSPKQSVGGGIMSNQSIS